jgi:hypothetical protein
VAYYDISKAGLSRIIKDARWLDLGDEARTTVLLGYSAQAQQCPKVLNFLFIGKGGNDCEKWTSCNKARLEMGRLTNTNLGRGRRAISPLDVWREPVWAAAEQMFKPLCSNCVTEAKALQAVAREKCWDELPKMFGLPGWEELEEMRRLALST